MVNSSNRPQSPETLGDSSTSDWTLQTAIKNKMMEIAVLEIIKIQKIVAKDWQVYCYYSLMVIPTLVAMK